MTTPNYYFQIKDTLESSLQNNTFVKLTLGDYKGSEEALKSLLIKLILIKNEPKLSFTYRYKTKDIVKNYTFNEAFQIIETYVNVNGFRLLSLFTIEADFTLQYIKADNWKLHKKTASISILPSSEHDKVKNRKIASTGKKYLQELKITDAAGNVFKNAQDKYKQINHYVEILSSLLKELPDREQINVTDMGAGKGYLTFALYDYLNNVLQKPAHVTGVEFRQDLVELCNKTAQNADFTYLKFVKGAIEDFDASATNVLIALHACDTATDDAIAKGILANADLIVVAPCCHKQIRREIEKNKVKNELDFLIKYGIFLERQAEMVTDGIRALILEYFGYSTKVFQFVSDAHTPKNVLIVGQKRQNTSADKVQILAKIQQSKVYFGIGYHYLERKLGLET